ncbi:MAG: transposase, partial [Myxococcota bacterium]
MGRSRGGLSTKIHALVDSTGKPLRLIITEGQQHEATVAETLIDFIHANACIADGGYDSDRIIGELKNRGIAAVIPPRSLRLKKRRFDKKLY